MHCRIINTLFVQEKLARFRSTLAKSKKRFILTTTARNDFNCGSQFAQTKESDFAVSVRVVFQSQIVSTVS